MIMGTRLGCYLSVHLPDAKTGNYDCGAFIADNISVVKEKNVDIRRTEIIRI